MSKAFFVETREIHYSIYMVEAENKEEAKDIVKNGGSDWDIVDTGFISIKSIEKVEEKK